MTYPFRNRLLMTSLGGFHLRRLLSILVLSLSLAPFASADIDLQLIPGSSPEYFLVSGKNQNISSGDWNVSVTATSNPTFTPFGLDLNLSASCTVCNGNLQFVLTADSFTTPVSALTATFSGYATNMKAAHVQSASGQLLIPIGVGGGPSAGPDPYSLIIDEVFTPSGRGQNFSADVEILGTPSTVPEPTSIALLGGVLLFTGSRLRKRLQRHHFSR